MFHYKLCPSLRRSFPALARVVRHHLRQSPQWLNNRHEGSMLPSWRTIPTAIRQLFRQKPVHSTENPIVLSVSHLGQCPNRISRRTNMRFKLLIPSRAKRNSAGLYVVKFEKMIHSTLYALVPGRNSKIRQDDKLPRARGEFWNITRPGIVPVCIVLLLG